MSPVYFRQTGATLLILLLVMMSILATLLVSNLRSRNTQTLRREQSAAAIQTARQALLAWSLSRDGDVGSNSRALTPVELPCPADPNETFNLGTSRSTCNTEASIYSRTGLLPWKTLGIPKLMDGYGEPLWYSVDRSFVVRTRFDESRKVNSDSFALLQVFSGSNELTANGEGAAVVIFSAGPPLAGQVRASPYTVSQYLEGVANQSNATLGGPYIIGDVSSTFNDQLAVLTGRDLIDGGHPRLGAEVVRQLEQYYLAAQRGVPIQPPAGVTDCLSEVWSSLKQNDPPYAFLQELSYKNYNWIANSNISNPKYARLAPKLNINNPWTRRDACGAGTSEPPPLTPYPYPADLATLNCQDDDFLADCGSELNRCAGILPRTQASWSGSEIMTPANLASQATWFFQNVWHRGVFYAVKQGDFCKLDFVVDGAVHAEIDAIFIIAGAARTNLPARWTKVMPVLTDYLEDVENQDAWTADNHHYVTPSCSSNDVMYTCQLGLCSKRKKAC